MKNILVLNMALFFFVAIGVYGQHDFTNLAKPVYKGVNSTALSIYDANPESPDGNYLCFIVYPEIVKGGHAGPPVQAHVMILNRHNQKIKKIYDIWCTNHNGANAIWINDSLVAFQVNHLKDFVVYNIYSNQAIYKRNGELGHKSFQNRLYYTICNKRLTELDKTRPLYSSESEGIYFLDCITGQQKQVVTKKTIVDSFKIQNEHVTSDSVAILHVEPNSTNQMLMFDYRHPRSGFTRWEQLHGLMDAEGKNIRWVKERPMHVIWYDNNHMLGVDTKDAKKRIYLYNLAGEKLEVLGGTSTHVGTSPDRQWLIGERGYYQADHDGYTRVYLYKRGEEMPYALLAEWNNSKITWKWVAHVNPSFSKDNKRAYFIRAVNGEDKFEAVYIELPKTSD